MCALADWPFKTSHAKCSLPACCALPANASSPPPPCAHAGPLSLAAAAASHVVVATGSTVQLLHISPQDGTISCTSSVDMPQQVSALALLPLGECPAVSGACDSGSYFVGVGLWVANQVALLQLPGLQGVGGVDLGEQQARSVALLPVHGQAVLLVGTSTGEVMLWELLPTPIPGVYGGFCWRGAYGRCVSVSTTSVQLLRAPRAAGAPAAVYAHAGSDALIAPVAEPAAGASAAPVEPLPLWWHSGDNRPPATGSVRVSRVAGAEGLGAVAAVHAPGMPHSLAWITPAGRLCFGALDAAHRLRWASARVGDTPEVMAVHAPSGCVVLLTRGAQGEQHLRVVEGSSLRQVLAVRCAEFIVVVTPWFCLNPLVLVAGWRRRRGRAPCHAAK